MEPMGLMPARFGSREGTAPTRDPEAKAPLATSTAPVALQQSRILQTSPYSHLHKLDCQKFTAARFQNPVLNRPCPVLNRRCPVLFRPRHQKLDGHALAQTEFVNRLDLTEVRFISNDELQAVAERHGANPEEAADAATINEAARLHALKLSFFCLSLIAVLPIAVAFFLPRKPCKASG